MANESDDVLSPLPVNGTKLSDMRSNSISAASEDSQTAQEFINSQLQLEADAREAMPYQFDTCTRPLGPLRQTLFSCLTCNPPPSNTSDPYTPAGVCYSCSISCHGEHELVELFSKRNFVCDCGTTRIPETTPCTLRSNAKTGSTGNVTGETPVEANRYNHNYANRFCGCNEAYNPHQEKGTMFQCVGLGTEQEGGCGEDWWHPECLVGLPRNWHEKADQEGRNSSSLRDENSLGENVAVGQPGPDTEPAKEHPVPPGFPSEDDFDFLLCYKCIDANPWLKRYTSAPGFLPAVIYKPSTASTGDQSEEASSEIPNLEQSSKKRRFDEDDADVAASQQQLKRARSSTEADAERGLEAASIDAPAGPVCDYKTLPAAPEGRLSLFCKEDFREHMCRCPECYPRLRPFPQLLEEEDTYEPALSEDGDGADGGQSVGTGSLLDRGEAALSNVDRVRAIEGVMVYNHLKDKVKSFLQPFAESGQAVGAEDIKAYFEKLRGDAEGMKQAAAGAGDNNDDGEGDGRKEQRGY